MKNLAGKVALVTGAAGGIGRGCALELAKAGAQLVLADIDENGLAAVENEVIALGTRALAVPTDVARPEAVERLAARAIEEMGRVDLLLNNAGVSVVAPAAKMTIDDWEWIVSINLWGPVRLIHALLPQMVARGSGHVVNVASMAGLVGAPGMSAYSLTKFGIVGYSEALRLEAAEHGIEVTVVCPGYVRTNLHRATRYRNEGFRRFLDAPPRWYGVPVEAAAKRIVDGIRRREGIVTIGPERAGWLLKRLSPEVAFRTSRWLARGLGLFQSVTG
jgi:NAD(P)-dependent dehydrogenase (short-subunit alcohol dehydrogenase family)